MRSNLFNCRLFNCSKKEKQLNFSSVFRPLAENQISIYTVSFIKSDHNQTIHIIVNCLSVRRGVAYYLQNTKHIQYTPGPPAICTISVICRIGVFHKPPFFRIQCSRLSHHPKHEQSVFGTAASINNRSPLVMLSQATEHFLMELCGERGGRYPSSSTASLLLKGDFFFLILSSMKDLHHRRKTLVQNKVQVQIKCLSIQNHSFDLVNYLHTLSLDDIY